MLLVRAKQIRDLRLQVSYPLIVDGQKITTYRADFVYVDCQKNLEIVEDVKGFKTREYQLKKKLLLALYGIQITET